MLLNASGRVQFARQRRLIRSALASLELERGHFGDAVRASADGAGDISDVIRFHALAADQLVERAQLKFKNIVEAQAMGPFLELVEEIARRFKIVEGVPSRTRDWIFRAEAAGLAFAMAA
jgi:hypothetical protein